MKTNFLQALAEEGKYQEYLRRIDPEKVLDHYGAQNSFEIQRSDGEIEVQHSCLIDRVDPHHTHGDANPSARMNLDQKLYICYSYGGGDIFWLIRTLEGKESFTDILPLLGQFLNGATEEKEDFLEELEGCFSGGEKHEDPVPVYSDRVLKQWSVTHPYLIQQRGVSHEAASRLRVGYDHEERRIVFPLFFEGQLVGWQKRAVPDGLGYPPTLPDSNNYLPKYKNTPGFPKSTTLYNYDLVRSREREEIVVVESPMSCLKAETLTDGDDLLSGVIATMGAKISDTQVSYLKNFKKVYVYMDQDQAGQGAARYLTSRLYRYTDCWVVESEEDKDLGDYNSREEVLDRIVNNSTPAFLRLGEWDREYARKRHTR